MSNAATGPAADDDVHVFLCLENGHYAVSTDPSGANIPAVDCGSGWRLALRGSPSSLTCQELAHCSFFCGVQMPNARNARSRS